MEYDEMRWIVDKEIMPLYLDTAKTFMNLSASAIGLTIIFREKIVGSQPGTRVNTFMLTSWVFYLCAVGAGAFYQYLAVKFLDSISCAPGEIRYFEILVRNPGWVYGVMLVLFFIASLFLMMAAWKQLPGRSS